MKRLFALTVLLFLLCISTFAERPAVIDALDYEKKVIAADYAANDGYDYGNHYIKIPKINVNSFGAQLLNEKMKEPYMEAYQTLIDNGEGNSIVRVDYEYKEKEGIIGIIIKDTVTVQEGGGNSGYKAYYYDSGKDKILNFDEYLKALNVTKSKIEKSSAVVKAYRDDQQPDNPVVLDAILDSKSSTVILEQPIGMNGWMTVKLNTPAVDVSPRKKDELYVGKVDEIVIKIGSKSAYVDGMTVENDVAPIISGGRTMLPARFVVENLGGEISWNEPEQKVTITKDGIKIELIINSDVATVNGNKVKLDCPVFIQNERTYTPVRFIVETLEATVDWYAYTEQVVIYKNISVADKLYDYYKEHKNEFVDGWNQNAHGFLADLDGDFVPELCLEYGENNYRGWIDVVKYKSGQIYTTENIISGGSYGPGILSLYELIIDENGKVFVWTEHESVNIWYDERMNSNQFYEYEWRELDNYSRYNITLSQNVDEYTYSENGGEEIKISQEKRSELFKAAENRYLQYEGRKIDLENCTFFEVWNKQKELKVSN